LSLHRQIKTSTLDSDALGEPRQVTVYHPPNHTSQHQIPVISMADGQSTSEYAALLEPLIADGVVPPLLLVGIHSPDEPAVRRWPDLRA
jgi:predicted esterase